MAFATSNVRKGTCGDLKITAGNWTGSVGDASGTIGVEGTQIYAVIFTSNDSTTPWQFVPYTWTSSGAVSTVTIHNRENVTAGNFIIFHA